MPAKFQVITAFDFFTSKNGAFLEYICINQKQLQSADCKIAMKGSFEYFKESFSKENVETFFFLLPNYFSK